MTYNITMVPSKEGFIGISDIPKQSQVHPPQMNIWAYTQNKPNIKSELKPKEPKMPVLVHVYVGALTVLGLYFLYRCSKQ